MHTLTKSPTLSVIIPFCNKAKLTIQTLNSLLASQSDEVLEIILVDNRSSNRERKSVDQHLQKLRKKVASRCVLLSWRKPFNWQKVNNFAAQRAKGSVLCFLNNDVIFDSSSQNLLRTMVRKALNKKVGVVGCLMRYPDGTVQHAGGHPDLGYHHNHFGGKMRSAYQRNRVHKYLTGACHVITAEKFNILGGYNDAFELLGGDIDLCTRSIQQGWHNYFVGSSSLIHLESKTRLHAAPNAEDFRKLYYSMMQVYSPKDGVEVITPKMRKERSTLERYYHLPLKTIQKYSTAWAGNDLEFIPAIPYRRVARVLVFCDGLPKEGFLKLARLFQTMRHKVLIVGQDLERKGFDGSWQKLDLSELSQSKRRLWIDTRLDDIILTSRTMRSCIQRSFSGHSITLI